MARKLANAKKQAHTTPNSSYYAEHNAGAEMHSSGAYNTTSASNASGAGRSKRSSSRGGGSTLAPHPPMQSQSQSGAHPGEQYMGQTWTGESNVVTSNAQDWYLRPDLDEKAHEAVWESMEKERRLEAHRQQMIQANRHDIRLGREQMIKKRLELEVKSGVLRDPVTLWNYGVDVDQLRSGTFSRDHDTIHKKRAEEMAAKIAQQARHRQAEIGAIRSRQRQVQGLEKTLGTPFQKSKSQVTRPPKGLKGAGVTYPPINNPGRCVSQAATDATAIDDDDSSALAELDTVFEERQRECRASRFSGSRKKENFHLSLNCKDLTQAVFTVPLH